MLNLLRLFCPLFCLLLLATSSHAQSFEETWKEFLTNNKVVNISALVKPDKVHQKPDYAKYLLMNMNSSFCQSEIDEAEDLMEEIMDIDVRVHESVPGFVPKLNDLQSKTLAYYKVDTIWQQFLRTRVVPLDKLDRIESVQTSCEKATLAKYSYMMMYAKYCDGDLVAAKDIFENRTLRLAEKTSWRLSDVEGLAAEVTKMKALYQAFPALDKAWNSYLDSGTSPGFNVELPLVSCNPVPNIKEYVLRGVADPCGAGVAMLEKIKKIQAEGLTLDDELGDKVLELEDLVAQQTTNLADLNAAWEAFLPDSRVKHGTTYGYDYCTPEPLVRAYIMDGYTFVCEMADRAIRNIDSLQKVKRIRLDAVTKAKIKELSEKKEQYQFNGSRIELVWDDFIADGDVLTEDYISTDEYCDYIQEVKDWTIRGLTGDCEQSLLYLNKIEDFNQRFEFKFYEDLECRVQKLRVKVWECRASVLRELAELEAASSSYEQRLEELMVEYNMEARPEDCVVGQ